MAFIYTKSATTRNSEKRSQVIVLAGKSPIAAVQSVELGRARQSLIVSTLRRRKKGRDTVQGVPSRFIAEMKLHEAQPKEDPREKLKALRAAAALRAEKHKSGTPSGQ